MTGCCCADRTQGRQEIVAPTAKVEVHDVQRHVLVATLGQRRSRAEINHFRFVSSFSCIFASF
jgi:hypothetical protein